MSESLPTLILAPNPPVLDGHRKASTDPPKPPMATNIVATIDRLKNWRRITPMVSASGGTQATGGSTGLTGSSSWRRAATAARSTSRPVTGASSESLSWTGPRSRRLVSWLMTPEAASVSRRRAAAKRRIPARTTSTGTAMAMIVERLMVSFSGSQIEEQPGVPREPEVLARAPEERADEDQHRPTEHEQGEQRDGELAVCGLVGRIAVDARRQYQPDQAELGQRHARDHGVAHCQEFLETQEVPGRLGGVRRLVGVGDLLQRRVHERREDQQERGGGEG